MKRMNLVTALATLLMVFGFAAASAEDTATKTTPPTYGPGWRHEQMMQARANGQWGFGPGMGMGMGTGMGQGMMQGRGGPPLKADGSIDTTRLPDGCPMKTIAPQK